MGERRSYRQSGDEGEELVPACACTMGGALFVSHIYVMMQPYTEGSKAALVAVDETMSAYVALKPYECCVCHTAYTAEEVKAFGVAKVVSS